MKENLKGSMSLAQVITNFSVEVLQSEETKNNPEMVKAITELLKIVHTSYVRTI